MSGYGAIRKTRHKQHMRALKKTAIYILILSTLLKLSGFLRESIIAKQFGANQTTDGFLLAYTVLTLFMLIIATGFNNVFLPIYTKNRHTNPAGTKSSANALLNSSLLLFLFTGLIFYFLLPVIAPWILGYTDKATLHVAITVGRFFSLFIFILSLNAILESYLQAKFSYVPTHVAKLLGTLFSALFGLFLAEEYGIMSLAYGFVFGTALGVLIQIIFLFKTGYPWRPELTWDPTFKKSFFILLWPSVLNAIVGPLNVFVDKLFATATIAGAVTYLNNASLIISIPNVVYTTTIGAFIFTFLTEASQTKKEFFRILTLGVEMGLLLFIPMALGLLIIGDDMVSFIYERGEFTRADTLATYSALALYTPLIATQGVQIVVSKALFALEKNKALLKISLTTIAINLLLNYLFMKWFGFKGLALSTSIVSVYYLATSIILLYRYVETEFRTEIWNSFLRIIAPTLIMGIALFLFKQATGAIHPIFIKLLFEIAIGMAVYSVSSLIFNRKGSQRLIDILKHKNKGTQPNK